MASPIRRASAAVWETDSKDFFSKPKVRLRRDVFSDLISSRIYFGNYPFCYQQESADKSESRFFFLPIFRLTRDRRLSPRQGCRSLRSMGEKAIVDDGYLIYFRMFFTGLRETFAKLVQSSIGVVRAEEEELVDPAKVLRVSLTTLRNDDGNNINVL